MTMTNNTKPKIATSITALKRGPAWLQDQRRNLGESFDASPLPQRSSLLWRYTDPAGFLFDTPPAPTDPAQVAESSDQQETLDLTGAIVDFSGQKIDTSRLDGTLPAGVVISSLAEAAEAHPQLIEKYLYQQVSAKTGKFEALNGALWHDGIFIQIPDKTVVEQPIHLRRLAGGPGTTQFPRMLVVVGQQSAVTLIDDYCAGATYPEGQPSQVNSAVEIFAAEAAEVRYVCLQRQLPATQGYLTYRARIEREAKLVTIPLIFGAGLSKHNFGVTLAGPGADSQMYGLLFGSGHQHADNHTEHHHESGQTTSNIDFKVVLRDRAASAYTGLIRIDHEAATCEAYQENRNLMLSSKARAVTIPELEILNEDVSCSHGATIGPVDPLTTFYLASRGIPLDEAVRMIISGFVEPTLDRVPADLREQITGFVAERLKGI